MAGSIHTSKLASWGITSGLDAGAAVTGVVTDFESSAETVLAPEQNEVGSVINQTMYDKHFTCSCTVQVAAGTAAPKAGEAITLRPSDREQYQLPQDCGAGGALCPLHGNRGRYWDRRVRRLIGGRHRSRRL